MWDIQASKKTVDKTIGALSANNISSILFDDPKTASDYVTSLIPKGSSVLTETSITLKEMGLMSRIDESEEYESFRSKIFGISDASQRLKERRRMVNPDVVVGSAQAVTSSGHIYFASKSGSQLPPYAYSASKAIIVIGTQKIVGSDEDAMRRIKERCVPMENERALKEYGHGTSLNKLFIILKEEIAGRLIVVFINKSIGF